MNAKEFSDMLTRINNSTQESVEYITSVAKLELKCHPKVFSPKYHPTTEMIISNFPFIFGEELLEMGCGIFALGLHAAKFHHCNVTGLDINPDAIKVAQDNINHYHLSNKAKVMESNLFSALSMKNKFDTIIWDFPFVDPPQNFNVVSLHHKAFFDPGYQQVETFLKQSFDFLRPNGRLILGFGGNGDESKLDVMLKSLYLKKEVIGKALKHPTLNLTTILYLIKKI